MSTPVRASRRAPDSPPSPPCAPPIRRSPALLDEELDPQEETLELIPSENLASVAVLEALGLVAEQQVRRGSARQALLRRLPGRRQGREPRPRPRQGALRRRARQRPAALGHPGQHGGLRERAQPGRQGARHGARPGRPPQPRLAGELQRQDLPLRAVFRRRDTGSARHGRGARARPRGAGRR